MAASNGFTHPERPYQAMRDDHIPNPQRWKQRLVRASSEDDMSFRIEALQMPGEGFPQIEIRCRNRLRRCRFPHFARIASYAEYAWAANSELGSVRLREGLRIMGLSLKCTS